MISCDDVTYDYPGRRALDGISFTLQPQTITALVGPNGAGKTTLLRCLAALDSPLSGRIGVGDLDVAEDPRGAHRRLGYLPDTYGLYESLSVSQCLSYFAAAHGLAKSDRRQAVQRAAQRLNIDGRMDQAAGTLSRGLRQRLGIAQSIIHEPEVLLLDEPASGLDPEARIDLGRLLLDLRDNGMTILVSSHILAELEDYSSHMLVLDKGRLVEHSALSADATEETAQGRQRLVVRTLGDASAMVAALSLDEAISGITVEGDKLVCYLSSASDEAGRARYEILRGLIETGHQITDFALETERLQDAYIARLKASRVKDGEHGIAGTTELQGERP